MKSILPLALGLALGFAVPVRAQQSETLHVFRTPSLSPDGQTIAFSFQGDIWTVPAAGGDARRLTVHEAYDGAPLWSPDSRRIAFSSDRYGNNDVFLMPAKGGLPERLTYHSAADEATGWMGNETLLFATKRVYAQIEWENEIYQIDAKGGTESRLLDAFGNMPIASPDGQLIAFVKGPCRTAREDYRGPANREIWIYHVATKQYRRITQHEGNDFLPQWGDNRTLYFIGAQSGRYNIYRQGIDPAGQATGAAQAVTEFKDYGIHHFSVGNQGQSIVFEHFGEVFLMPAQGGKAAQVPIEVANDYRFDPIEHQTFRKDIDEYEVSPNGKLVAFAIRGEIFVKENDPEKPRAVNISQHPYRDYGMAWLNDSTLVFSSDREGQSDLFLARSADPAQTNLFKSLKHQLVRLTKTDIPEFGAMASPDGKQLAFKRGHSYGASQFVVADVEAASGKLSGERVLQDGWAQVDDAAWSPDSRWIAYSMPDLTFNADVYIHAADNSRPAVNVSMHPRADYGPVWSADGSKLAFVSQRTNGSDIWFAWLRKRDWEKTHEDWKDDEDEGKEEDKKKKDEDVKPLQIDFEDIHYRLTQLTSFPGDEGAPVVSNDGQTIYFTAQTNSERLGSDLYSIRWDGQELSQLTQGTPNPSGLSLTRDGQQVYYLQRGALARYPTKGGKPESLPHEAYLAIDHPQERRQIFEEAWTAIDRGFYDPQFHGKDWKALGKRYQPVCLAASTQTDFQFYFNLMLGQLNASHMGLYGSDRQETQEERTGLLGVELAPHAQGVEVRRVVKDAPADKEQSRLLPGDVIVQVNGVPTKGANFHSLLANKAHVKVLLQVRRQGRDLEVVIRPTNSLRIELYNEWVAVHKALVDKYSNGQLGYIHIQGMNWPSFERFERELTASGMGKKGIVIDVRYNGGGWTTDYLMAVLNVDQHAYTIPRGAAKSLGDHEQFKPYYPFGERLPFGVWNKPSVAMCNEASYSNAEIFSHAYKSLGIGPLVGIPTFGAVISTGAHGLIDGSYVRMPFRAWFVKNSGMNMENGPAVPDIVVENTPGYKAQGEDEQLRKAVEALLQGLK